MGPLCIFYVFFLSALSLYLMGPQPDKPPHYDIYWALQCSIDFYILWLVEPMRAHKLYTEESMTCLDRCAELMHEWIVRQRRELTGHWGDWWITVVKQRCSSREALGPCAWMWNSELTGGTTAMLLVQCVQCRAPHVFLMPVKTTTRWSDSSNSYLHAIGEM